MVKDKDMQFFPTQDAKPSLGRRPKDGFVSKLVSIFRPAKKWATYPDIQRDLSALARLSGSLRLGSW